MGNFGPLTGKHFLTSMFEKSCDAAPKSATKTTTISATPHLELEAKDVVRKCFGAARGGEERKPSRRGHRSAHPLKKLQTTGGWVVYGGTRVGRRRGSRRYCCCCWPRGNERLRRCFQELVTTRRRRQRTYRDLRVSHKHLIGSLRDRSPRRSRHSCTAEHPASYTNAQKKLSSVRCFNEFVSMNRRFAE